MVAVAAAALAASGCSYTSIVRGDLAKDGVKNQRPPIALTASVAPVVNRTNVTSDACFAFSKSYLTVLEKTAMFEGTYAEVELPDADVKFQPTLKKVEVYQNNWYLASWVILGVATFGLFPGIGALLGLPYSTESGYVALEVRALDGKTGSVIATYDTVWEDTLVFNIYNSGSVNKETFYVQPWRAVQAGCGRSVEAILADYPKYEAIARARSGAPPPPPAPGPTAAQPNPPGSAPPSPK